MTTALVTRNLWRAITRGARSRPRTAFVAVPYFSKRGNTLLPLRAGSRLVVNASEGAVKIGQTSPKSLLALHRKGVRIYSNPSLHAKVYVFGTTAFIGSANASGSSESGLIEAVVRTSDQATVKAAREFVRGLCDVPLGPEALARLAKLYREPRGGAQGRGAPGARGSKRQPKVWIAQVSEEETPPEAVEVEELGYDQAKERQSKQSYEVEDFHCSYDPPYRVGDTIVEVFAQSDGRVMVSPPGRVIHRRSWRGGRRRITFVYFERPARHRVAVERLAKDLGYGAKSWLRRDGVLRDDERRDRLFAYFNRDAS